MSDSRPSQSNTFGNASLALGVVSAALVFGIGFCGLAGVRQGWIGALATILFMCGANSAFLGFVGLLLGMAALFEKERVRSTAVAGLVLSSAGIFLFLLFLRAIKG